MGAYRAGAWRAGARKTYASRDDPQTRTAWAADGAANHCAPQPPNNKAVKPNSRQPQPPRHHMHTRAHLFQQPLHRAAHRQSALGGGGVEVSGGVVAHACGVEVGREVCAARRQAAPREHALLEVDFLRAVALRSVVAAVAVAAAAVAQ